MCHTEKCHTEATEGRVQRGTRRKRVKVAQAISTYCFNFMYAVLSMG